VAELGCGTGEPGSVRQTNSLSRWCSFQLELCSAAAAEGRQGTSCSAGQYAVVAGLWFQIALRSFLGLAAELNPVPCALQNKPAAKTGQKRKRANASAAHGAGGGAELTRLTLVQVDQVLLAARGLYFYGLRIEPDQRSESAACFLFSLCCCAPTADRLCVPCRAARLIEHFGKKSIRELDRESVSDARTKVS
jgi:hypothetical protein